MINKVQSISIRPKMEVNTLDLKNMIGKVEDNDHDDIQLDKNTKPLSLNQ